MNHPLKVLVVSDVGPGRDGLGIEIHLGDELVLEIFRDDTQKTRSITIFRQNVPLSIVEESIAIFKKEVPWEFIDDGSIEPKH